LNPQLRWRTLDAREVVLSRAKQSSVGAVAGNIKASVDDVWAVLTDGRTWRSWWPDGELDPAGPWGPGGDMTWPQAQAPENRHGKITELRAPDPGAPDHEVDAAGLWFTVDQAHLDFRIRVDGVARGVTNVILSRYGPPLPGWGIKAQLARVRLEKGFQKVADDLKDAVEAHVASRGPHFHYETRELFLSGTLHVYLHQQEAIRIRYEQYQPGPTTPQPNVSEGMVPIEVLVTFPPLCSACLETTSRTHTCPSTIYSSGPTGTDMIRSQTVTTSFEVPICERCASYGLDGLIYISGHTIPTAIQKKDMGDWVNFRFPNIAYCQPFLDTNGLPHDRIAPGTFEGSRATQRGRDVGKLEQQLDAWREVRDGFGFHTYANLKYELLQLPADAPDLEQRLTTVAAEHSVTVERLRDVERIAGEPIPALRALDV
jgi:hypothetical protein